MLTKSQSLKDNYFFPLLFTASARAGWKHLLAYFGVKEPYAILLPPYIGVSDSEGSGIFDPVIETATPYGFYQLDNRLAVDLLDLERQLRTGEFKMLLLVHYFGFCRSNLRRIKELCRIYDIILVEDCAHALGLHQADTNLGNIGDFSLYSLHQYLPFTKGGILKTNNKKWLLSPLPKELELDEKWIGKFSSYDLGKINSRRRSNYKFLQISLTNVEGVTVMYDLEDGDVPHDFPILVANGLRDNLYYQLMDWDVPTSVIYHRLIDPLIGSGYEAMEEVSANILNLPIHQDIERKDLEILVGKLVEALKTLRS